jgi:hypothetical protein
MATKKSTSSRSTKKSSSSDDAPSAEKKPAAKKQSTRKRPAAKKQSGGDDSTSRRSSAPRAEAPKRSSASQVAGMAARQLLELIGKEPEGVTGLERSDDGWKVLVDVVELRRVPTTTDVLGTYEVEVDSDGELQGYRRVARYVRGDAGGE